MPEIRYVCLSDVHFGASNSLLTHMANEGSADPSAPSSTLVSLVECLRDLITKANGKAGTRPKLILNGDILDLALSSIPAAAGAFERFMDLAFPENGEPLFDTDMIYSPGNHDHHLWETAREGQYAQTVARVPWGDPLPDERHTTKLFSPDPPVNIAMLTELLRRSPRLKTANVQAAYPGYGLVSDDKKKCVVFSHGHYLESLYHLTTHLITLFFPQHTQPATLEALETENFAWIDFFWGTLGRSGAAGRDVSLLYDELQDEGATRTVLRTLAASLLAKSGKPGLIEWAETHLLDAFFESTLGHMARLGRNQTEALLGKTDLEGLKLHLEGPVHGQIECELGAVPEQVTFIFGHTHKPFETSGHYQGYAHPVALYNSGGWVVDALDPLPLEGGAVILVDENLEVASLRMYNEAPTEAGFLVAVESTDMTSSFLAHLRQSLDFTQAPWSTFSGVAAKAVMARRKTLYSEIADAQKDEGGSTASG